MLKVLHIFSYNVWLSPLLLLLVTSATMAATATDESRLQRAGELIKSQQAEEAYALLAPLEDELAGSRDFDYLLGMAALDSDRFGLAILALQRAVAVAPAFAGARMELARAYYEVKEYEHALKEFEILKRQHPPKYMLNVIESYIQSIQYQKTGKPESRFLAYVESVAGHDSNVNSATDEETFLGFTLSEQSREISSPFLSLNTGFSWLLPAGRNSRLIALANFKRRVNTEASFVNSTAMDGSLLFQQGFGKHNLTIGLSGSQLKVAGKENNQISGTLLQWRQVFSKAFAVGVNTRFSRIDYPAESAIREVDQIISALTMDYFPGLRQSMKLGLQLFSGTEFKEGQSSPYERNLSGGRIQFMQQLPANISWSLGLGMSNSEYQGPFFGRERVDEQADVNLSLNWAPYKSWVFTSKLSSISNGSDITIYEYKKTSFSLAARWLFLE